jgi:ATP-binding cassette subfamily C (CFTR/MRP) protein 1
MAAQCSPAADNTLGPAITADCRFDFTLLFEQSFLSLVPAAIFIIISPWRFAQLLGRDTKTLASSARFHKIALAVILAGLLLAVIVLWGLDKPGQTKTSLVSSVLNLVACLQILGLTWIEDAKSVRPSSLLTGYLLLTILFDIAQIRTLWLRHSDMTIAAVFTCSTAIKVLLLILEARQKKNYLKQAYKTLPPESTSGIINRSFLWWINDLFRQGLASVLAVEQLYVLDEKLVSAPLAAQLQDTWEQRQKPERRFEFPWATFRALWRPFVLTIFPRLCLIGFTFAQPFLISRVLTILGGPDGLTDAKSGYALIGATMLIYLGLALSNLHYNQSLYRFMTMFRGATISLIYRHMLTLPAGAHDDSAALTLMNADVDRIILCLVNLNECWARLIEVAVGILLLALQLGWVCIITVVLVLSKPPFLYLFFCTYW